MVLERLWRRSSKDEPSDRDNPTPGGNGANDDCLSCRIVGATALVTLGGATYITGMNNLQLQRAAIERSKSRFQYGSRRLGVIALSATLVGLGLYRTVN